MKVSISDDLYDRLKAQYKTPQAVDRAVNSAAELASLTHGHRTLVLDAAQIGELESLLQGGSLLNGADLMRKVHQLADLKVGAFTLPLDARDLDRMAQRAARIGMTVPEYATMMFNRFKEDWMMIGEPQDIINERMTAGTVDAPSAP